MRILAVTTLTLAVLTLAGCASLASSTAASPSAETVRVVIRPVTEAGVAGPGYTVTSDQTVVDCGSASHAAPSSVAVDDGILSCSPASAYAVACWKDPAPATVVCYRDPWTKDLVRMPNSGDFAAATAPAQAQPLGLLLSDGDRCLQRNGGVWNELVDHPGWYGTYSCIRDGAVWAETSNGIDQSSPRWTVRVAPISGDVPPASREVVKAFFIGTREG